MTDYEFETLIHNAQVFKEVKSESKKRLLMDILELEETKGAFANNVTSSSTTLSTSSDQTQTKVIRHYYWDQSDYYLKLYIPLEDVQNLNKENIKCKFEKQGLDLQVLELKGKNHVLTIANFAYPIVPEKSYFKVKTDMVVVLAAKAFPTWEAITLEEKRILDAESTTKPDLCKEDKNADFMVLIKKIYDDDDDEIKMMFPGWKKCEDQASFDFVTKDNDKGEDSEKKMRENEVENSLDKKDDNKGNLENDIVVNGDDDNDESKDLENRIVAISGENNNDDEHENTDNRDLEKSDNCKDKNEDDDFSEPSLESECDFGSDLDKYEEYEYNIHETSEEKEYFLSESDVSESEKSNEPISVSEELITEQSENEYKETKTDNEEITPSVSGMMAAVLLADPDGDSD